MCREGPVLGCLHGERAAPWGPSALPFGLARTPRPRVTVRWNLSSSKTFPPAAFFCFLLSLCRSLSAQARALCRQVRPGGSTCLGPPGAWQWPTSVRSSEGGLSPPPGVSGSSGGWACRLPAWSSRSTTKPGRPCSGQWSGEAGGPVLAPSGRSPAGVLHADCVPNAVGGGSPVVQGEEGPVAPPAPGSGQNVGCRSPGEAPESPPPPPVSPQRAEEEPAAPHPGGRAGGRLQQ